MSVNSLYDAFVRAATAATISADILPLMGKLVTGLGVTTLPLTAARAERLPTTARLTANTTWPDTTGWSLSLIGSVDVKGRDVLSLNLQARTERGFVALKTLVPDLPQSRLPSPDVPGTLMLGASVLADLGPEQASVSLSVTDDVTKPAGLPELTGWLLLAGTTLARYSALLGNNPLALAGHFDPRASAAVASKVDLIAQAPDDNGSWINIPLEGLALALTTAQVDVYSLDKPQGLLSIVEMVLTLSIDSGRPQAITVRTPLLNSDTIWDFSGRIVPPLTLTDGINALTRLFPGAGSDIFNLPAGLAPLDEFGLSALRYGVQTEDGSFIPAKTLYTGATIVSTSQWDPSIPFILIEQVGIDWLVNWVPGDTQWSGNLFGTLRFGAKTADGSSPAVKANIPTDMKGNPVYLDVSVSLPGLVVEAQTRGAIELDLSKAMAVFFPGTQPSVGAALVVDYISMSASIYEKTYGATLNAHGTWEIPIGDVSFSLDDLSFQVTVAPATIWGGLSAVLGLSVEGVTTAQLSVGAYYPGDGNWDFQGGLAAGTLNLTQLVYAFLGQTAPGWLPALELTRLWATYSTADGNPYSVSAAVAVQWDPEVLGIKLLLVAEADIKRRKKIEGNSLQAARDTLKLQALEHNRPRLHEIVWRDNLVDDAPVMIYEGSVKGSFELNNLIVTVGLSFMSQEQTWLFRLQLDRFALEARTSWTGKGAARHQVLTVEMQGVTLGAMIESLAALANPNANYRLEAPWTFLNSINLGRFTLVIDPTEQSVTLDYAIDLHLGFITIKTVGIRYDRKTGEPQVNIEITGNFLGKEYGREPDMTPLGWDALNDSPPAIPGKGNALVDLRYLGFGQHVSLDGLTQPNSLSEVITLMRAQLRPSDDPMRNPLNQPTGNKLHFDESSQWLIGLDVTVMGTVSVKLVMHDPDLYGVLIALGGPEAGSLAGFSFELLYKKVTDDIGVFHARLQVPDMFRQLDFGALAITLGIITVDVFTNGNFKIDLGFPHARDFSISFGLQYGPFMGKGGIYFGVLNGATSTQVPAITNGTFSPVLELGIGLAVGIGREFNKGPLKAGLYVQLEVIFEGVLAWFHPDDAAASKAMYYSAQGTAALVGKVYGKVDFKIISIDVSFEAYAAASIRLAAYRPTLVEMHVGVRVHASIKVLFIRISFSFSTSLDVSFTIGSASTTPWVLSADQSGRTPGLRATDRATLGRDGGVAAAALPNASRNFTGRRRRPADMSRLTRQLTRARLQNAAAQGVKHPLSAQLAALADGPGQAPCAVGVYRLNFSPDAKVYADGAVLALDVRILPAFTVAAMPLTWPDTATATPANSPAYRMVVMLSIDSPAPAQASSLEEARLGRFNPTARAGSAAETPFAVLAEGLFRWSLTAIGLDPQNATLTAGDLVELAAQMDCPQTFAEGFAFDNLSGFLGNNVTLQVSGIPAGPEPDGLPGVCFPMPPALGWTSPDLPPTENTRDFATFQPVDDAYAARIASYFSKLSPQPAGSGSLTGGGIDSNESLASVIFREYLLLVSKSMVQAAENLFARFPVVIDEDSTLAGIANITDFPIISVDYVMHLGDTLDQVAETYGYGAAELLALNPGLEVTLAGAAPGTLIPLQLGVTPESITAANPERVLAAGKTLHADALETQILTGETPAALCSRVGAVVDTWLDSVAALDVPQITRAAAPLSLPQASYANPSALTLTQAAALFYIRFNAGTAAVALVPEADWYAEAISQLNDQGVGADGSLPATVQLPSAYDSLTNPVTWTRLSGDSLALLAAATALWQNPTVVADFATWLTSVQRLNPGYSGGALLIPATSSALLPDETLRALAARLLLVTDPTAELATPSGAFTTLVASADILAPLGRVVVSDCTLTTAAAQTLRDFASTYDLTIETVGRLGADVPGLILPDAKHPLIVPTLAAVKLATLMPKLTGDAPVRDVAGQVARFMLHGQRLPVPGSSDDSQLAGIYDLVGQQVSSPAPDATLPPESVRMTLTIAPTQSLKWINLVQTETAPANVDVALFSARAPDFLQRNPAAAANRLRPGMILEVGDSATLTLAITEKMLNTGYPATVLAPVLTQAPQALQLWQDVPVRHGLAQRVIWQVPSRPELPCLGAGAAIGMPSFWPFSASLNALAAAADDKPWQLYRADPQLGPNAPPVPIEHFVWATLLDIRINRVPGRPHTAEVVGADTAGRQLLLELWQYLEDNLATDNAELFFGFQLSPSAGLAAGLASTQGNPDASYLVRTNLSTETRSGNLSSRRPRALAAGDAPPSGPYYAPMSNALGFLTLLWEASVVGGGGYWLDLTDAAGNGLGDEIWGPDGNALISLVVVLDSQSQATPQRRLYSFNNTALLGDPVDTSSNVLFVAAPDDRDQVRQATVAQGNVGFTFGISNPPDLGDTPALNARRLYNLAGYQLLENAVFEASHDGRPVSPQLLDGGAIQALRMATPRLAASDDDQQTITQVIPIHRFAKTARVPAVPGLPPAAQDPYAGISSGDGSMLSSASVALCFHDIFGNSTAPGPSGNSLEGDA
ncbi:hypothetical protein [Pseudomonas veronii]|uniref:hypothetical protein n=1 Tax=Pseudomonas veronii TaxID=76761 RepID=UPI0021C0C63E|nr:hypothetical protein [Pseudomonas veronii]MCT9825452.1 hypothetical protein [Pseudomonas veronii]